MAETDLSNKTIFITGASSGIGQACAQVFAKMKAKLVITARRYDRLMEVASRLSQEFNVDVKPIMLDVQNSDDINRVVAALHKESIDIDVLINNAGLALSTDKIHQGDIQNWDIMIDTNIKGILYVTRAILPRMLEKNSGHIINIGSVAGHDCYVGGNVYSATKHAVRAITKSLRIDLFGHNIRVSEVAPGAVHTEFSEVRWKDKARADKLYEGFSPLTASDIADAVLYCATRPAHVNVAELVVYPQAQASVSQIHRT